MPEVGPVPSRQDAPHLHDAILDPTKRFIMVTDLGSDMIRIYTIGRDGLSWSQLPPIGAEPGSGPRHGAFAVAGDNTYFYSVNELGNSITGYIVEYAVAPNAFPISFAELFTMSTHGPDGMVPAGTKAAEIVVSVSFTYSSPKSV
jgi:6-phosphogluconolactonase (cycloisomerase 2 family)